MPNGRNQQVRHVVHSGPQVTGRTNRSQTPQPSPKQREQQLTSSATYKGELADAMRVTGQPPHSPQPQLERCIEAQPAKAASTANASERSVV